jgi:hypothetical protein
MSVRLMALTAYCIPVSLCVATRTVENVPVPVPPSTQVRAYLAVAAECLLGSLLWHAHVASLSWHAHAHVATSSFKLLGARSAQANKNTGITQDARVAKIDVV